MNSIPVILCLALTGCASWPTEQTEFINAPNREQANRIAAKWVAASPAHSLGSVAGTGSMRPVLRGGEILLQEKYDGGSVKRGEILVFDRGDAHNVIHRAADVNDRAVYFSGDNCRRSDGWFPRSVIKLRVPKIITLPR